MLKNIIVSAIIGFIAGLLGSSMTGKTRESDIVVKMQAALEERIQRLEALKDKIKDKADQANVSAEFSKDKTKEKIESIKEKAKEKIDQLKEKNEEPTAAKKNGD